MFCCDKNGLHTNFQTPVTICFLFFSINMLKLYDPLSQMRFQFLRPTFQNKNKTKLLLRNNKKVTEKNLLNVRLF